MKPIKHVWRILSLKNRKLNSLILLFIFIMTGFLGAFTILLPSFLNRSISNDKPIDNKSGSNLGYEELINIYIDRYGNLTVHGSFQGPQITPDVNFSLPEYDYIIDLELEVVNPNATDYIYKAESLQIHQNQSKQDVYLHFIFPIEGSISFITGGVVLNEAERDQTAIILKNDIEQAFGIQNNFSINPIGSFERPGLFYSITYGFNYTDIDCVDYDYFLQYFEDHTPSGLADSLSPNRINSTKSWLNWIYSNNFQNSERASSLMRNPFADYNTSFECNVYLSYSQYFGFPYLASSYSFNLSEILDVPFNGLSQLNESAFSTSEINVIVENGNITSPASPPYHLSQYLGLDHDFWILRNTSYYDTFVYGLESVSDIQVNFTTGLAEINFVLPPPPPATVEGDVNINVQVNTNLTSGLPMPIIVAQIYNRSVFFKKIFDDYTSSMSMPGNEIETIYLGSIGFGNYAGSWDNTYRYSNGDYIIEVFDMYTNLSGLGPRGGPFGGMIYNWSPITLLNPGQISLNITSPTSDEVVVKNVNITANITSPEPIINVEYLIINYSQYYTNNLPMVSGKLTNTTLIKWNATWDSTTIPSTEDYILRISVTDINSTFYRDVHITVNNTLYQENIPIYAPMGGQQGYGYDLYIGDFIPPGISDPFENGDFMGPAPHMFFGYGVDFGIDFTSLLYKDVIGVFIAADNNHTRNLLWNMLFGAIEENADFIVSVWMMDNTPESQVISSAIYEEAKVAFNLPDLVMNRTFELNFGEGPMYFYTYGANYSTIQYEDFIDKFHASVPTGLAGIYTKNNMTQSNINSSILFGWANPNKLYGEMIYQEPLGNYNVGQGTWISPTIYITKYFNASLGQQQEISLKKLFPQISQINSCAPTVASTVLSGFGQCVFGPLGGIVLNANITNWYPQDPLNVTPLFNQINDGFLNIITFTMLNTSSTPYGLRTTDDIQYNFTGPFITNNILTPTLDQSIELEDYNVTIESQVLIGDWNQTQYVITLPYGLGDTVWEESLLFNGTYWTNVINSLNITSGYYMLTTYARDDLGNWILNSTFIYINNSLQFTILDIYINDWGDVEISSAKWNMQLGSMGYSIQLGIDRELYNVPGLNVRVHISANNTPNIVSNYFTNENWNVFITVLASTTTIEEPFNNIAEPIIENLASIFGIEGLLQTVEANRDYYGGSQLPILAWGMNYTQNRDYNYFLDHYEKVQSGNLSKVLSKENILKANQSFIDYYILPEDDITNYITLMGFPRKSDFGDGTFLCAWMKFDKIYNYTTLNQTYNFSLADFLGVKQLNTDLEREMTSAICKIFSQVSCGNHTYVYPNITPYTTYLGNSPSTSYIDTYQYEMLMKQYQTMIGINDTDDLRFNFTAPYTLTEVISPISGSNVHGNLSLIVNATMLDPAFEDAIVQIYPGNSFIAIPQIVSPLEIFNITYDSVNQCWNGTWMTVNESIPNGWYDIVFMFYDAFGRQQRNYTHVYLENKYYVENLGVTIDQFGNITASMMFQGNPLYENFNYSISEYQDVKLAAFVACNAYTGFPNYSKQLITTMGNTPENDFICMIGFSMGTPEAEAIQLAGPVKDDFERVFGIEGILNFIKYGSISFSEMIPYNIIIYGNNYTSTLDYNYFIDNFHQQIPNGLNNTIPAMTLNGTDSFIEWLLFLDTDTSPLETPANFDETYLLELAVLFYPQYYGTNYITDTITPHNLSLTELFNLPQMIHAPLDLSDSMVSKVSITIENSNLTNWYPDIPYLAELNEMNEYEILLAVQNPYYEGDYQYISWEFLNLDDINVTFDEPMTRINVITPFPGSTIDGITNVSVIIVQNTSQIKEVTLKIYSESEYEGLILSSIYGENMPDSRPEGVYGEVNMIDVGGGQWNYTWPAYQHLNGPIWIEVVVRDENNIYAYNSTKVLISNSNPLAINVLSPSNGDSVSDMINLVTQVINSTPISQVICNILYSESSFQLDSFQLTAQGGNFYSTYWGSHGLSNGTYTLSFQVIDVFGAVAYNNSITIDVSNSELFEGNIMFPIYELEASMDANITANATGPYLTKSMYYRINQQIQTPWGNWDTIQIMSEGWMYDPNSVWVAELDTSEWPSSVYYDPDWDDASFFDVYYQVEITAIDIRNARSLISDRFPIGQPFIPSAEIVNPNDNDVVEDIFYIIINVTDAIGGDTFDENNPPEGEIHRTSDGSHMADIKFQVDFPYTTAYSLVGSYCYPNDTYTITVNGFTMQGGIFSDSINVYFNNSKIFNADLLSPSGTISGLTPSYAKLNYPYPIQEIRLNIYTNDANREHIEDINFYHKALMNVTTYNISSFADYGEYRPSLIEVHSLSYQYANAFIRNGNIYFGNSTDGLTWNYSLVLSSGNQRDLSLVQAFDGTLYIVYDENEGGYIRLINSTDGGNTWSPPGDIKSNIWDSAPCMIQLQNGSFMIVYLNNGVNIMINKSLSLMNKDWTSKQIYVETGDDLIEDPFIIEMSDGSFKVVLSYSKFYYVDPWEPPLIHIINVSSDTTSWSSPYLITPYRDGGSWEENPSLAEAQDGSLYIIFDSWEYAPYTRQLLIINSTNHVNWSSPSPVTWNTSESRNPWLIQRSDGQFMVAFESERLGDWELFITTFDNMTVCWNWTGLLPSYMLQNGSYILQLYVQDINKMEINSNELFIYSENPKLFEVNLIYPFDEAVITGGVTVQVDVQGPYPTEWVIVWIFPEGGENWLQRLDDLRYNTTSGYWEQNWGSWSLSDGSYEMETGAGDIYDASANDYNDFSTFNPVTLDYELLYPQPNKSIWGNYTFIVNASGPGTVKWVSWSTDRSDPSAEKYLIYQGLLNHTGPWLEYSGSWYQQPSVIQLSNGSLLMAYSSGNIYVTLKRATGWSSPINLGAGYNPCLFQLLNNTILLVYEYGNNIYWSVSYDNGTSWLPTMLALDDPSDEFHTPSLTQLLNETIIMAYQVWDGNDNDIEIAVLNETGTPTWGQRHVVLSSPEDERDPSIIRTINNDFVIAFEIYNMIATALSTDNTTTFGDIRYVQEGCYSEWNYWKNPSLIQSANGEYVIACEAENSPWSWDNWRSVIFVFNSSDRINWGIAKPIQNDTFYQKNYEDGDPSLIHLQNGTYLIAFYDRYNDYGIFFNTFDSFTEKGLWLLTVDTHTYSNGLRPFNFKIEDVWHVEENFTEHWHDWQNPGIFDLWTNYSHVLTPGDTLSVFFIGEAGMFNASVDIEIINITCKEIYPGFYIGSYKIEANDYGTNILPIAYLNDSYGNVNKVSSYRTINILNETIFWNGDYVIDGTFNSTDGQWLYINGRIIIINGGILNITNSIIELNSSISYPHQVTNGSLNIINSDIVLPLPFYKSWFNVSSNIYLNDVNFEFDITTYGYSTITIFRSEVMNVTLFDSSSLIASTNFTMNNFYAYNNSQINIQYGQMKNGTIIGNVTAYLNKIYITPNWGIVIGELSSWMTESSNVLIENCFMVQVWNLGIDNNVTIINGDWIILTIVVATAVNGTVTMRDTNLATLAPKIIGIYGQDYRNGTTVYGVKTIITPYIVYAYAGADLTLYNVTLGAIFVTDSQIVSNRTYIIGGSKIIAIDIVTSISNSNFTTIDTIIKGYIYLGDGTFGWGINTTITTGIPILEGNVMYMDFWYLESYPIDEPQWVYLWCSINNENWTSVEWTVNGTPQITEWIVGSGWNISIFWWHVAYDGSYIIGARANNSLGDSLYFETLVEVEIIDPTNPSVEIFTPLNGSIYQEYDPILITVNATDNILVDYVELWSNGTYIMDLTYNGVNWTCTWSYTIGWVGINEIQIKAYDTVGNVNDTEWGWINITLYIPPTNYADLYNVILTNSTGLEETTFNQGETVDYHATIRGDAGSNTYIVTAQTDDPLLQGYLEYNESVTVTAGQDIEVEFSYSIGASAPTGIYTVQIIIWTDWPWNGGICIDFITVTFEVV